MSENLHEALRAAVLFNRDHQVGMNGDQRDRDYASDLDDNFLRPRAFDFDKDTLTPLEHASCDSDFLCLGEIDFGRAEETQGLIVSSCHGDELAHLFLRNRDLLPKSLIHHVLQQGNAGRFLQLLDS